MPRNPIYLKFGRLDLTEQEAKDALESILDRLGVRAGDRVMLGIDMGGLPLPRYAASMSRDAFREREQKWCQFVFDALTERLTPHGTLLVPTFTYSCTRPGSVFVAESTPSETGPFTEFVRSKSEAIRSLHPIFSLAGLGRDAAALLTNTGKSAFGSMSPFSRFAEHEIRFLCLGAPLRSCITYIHHLEQSYGCPHRYNKSFDIAVFVADKPVPGDWYANMAYRGIKYSSDIASLQHALKACGGLSEAEWNGHPNHLAEIAAVDRVGNELLASDTSAFVNRRLRFHFDDTVVGGTELLDETSLRIAVSQVRSAA
jgi:aminoglycoside N3'-acetyltransferase